MSGETLTFDYEKLEKDVVEEFILGKPIISDDIENLRIPFKYRKPMAVTVGVGISEADVNSLSRYLGEDFQVYHKLEYYVIKLNIIIFAVD